MFLFQQIDVAHEQMCVLATSVRSRGNVTKTGRVCASHSHTPHAVVFTIIYVGLYLPTLPSYPYKTPPSAFKKANWEAIRQQIRSCWTSFSENSPSRSVNENWLKLKSILNQCLDKFIPTKMTSPRENLPWLSKSLLASIRKKKHLYIAKPSVRIKLTFGHNINYVNGRPSVPSGLPGGPF